MSGAEVPGEPAPALEIRLDLGDAGGDRHVERFDGRRPDDPVGLDPVTPLERPNAFREGFVEQRRVRRSAGSRGDVPASAQTVAQRDYALIDIAWRERFAGLQATPFPLVSQGRKRAPERTVLLV